MGGKKNLRTGDTFVTAVLPFVLTIVCLQGCATNFRGDLRYARLAPSEEHHTAEYSTAGTARQSAREDRSFEQPSSERESSPPDRRAPYSDAGRPSNSKALPDTQSLSDKTFGELFDGPLVGFVAGSLRLLWSHPLIWMGAMALAVLFEPVIMEYAGQAFFAP